MKNSIKNEEENEEEILNSQGTVEGTVESDENIKKTENTQNIVTTKYTRPPAFQKANNFWKWNFQTNNNRQRPWRAAWRWR